MELKWLIYCRVSSAKQVKEWNGLSSQEKRCRDYAKNVLWISIDKVFNDEWVSWWLFERKSIKELLNYIDNNKTNNYIVIFEDLNRLSRDIQVHSLLKAEFKKRWVELACPNFQFDESPEWDFKENISVAVSQYEKDKNKQRVINRMKARLEQGFWCFKIPVWYKFVEATNWWKIVVKDKETSNIVKSWLEKYAKWELKTLLELWNFFYKKWLKINWITSSWVIKSKSVIHRITTNILYTWYLECKRFWISRIKAQHEEIISLETYNKIQNRLKSMSNIERIVESNIERKDISNDFPLRWFLYCETSENMLSWGWSQWKNRKVPYYTFPRKSPLRWKSINRDDFHLYFENYLKNISPKQELLEAFLEVLQEQINNRNNDKIQYKENLKKELNNIDTKISNFISRIWNTNSESLISNYEREVENLEKEKTRILNEINTELKNVWTPLKNKIKSFSNSLEIWKNSNLENKKNLLKNIFPEWIPINEKKQVWTPTFSLVYQAFQVWKESNLSMVELMGFEPMS